MKEASSNSLQARHNKMVKLKFAAPSVINKLTKRISQLIVGDATHVIRFIKKLHRTD